MVCRFPAVARVSDGTINFAAGGGTLTTQCLYASPAQLTGTGTINANGLVSNVNLVFDSTHGLSQTVTGLGNVTLNLDMTNGVGAIGAGYSGNGSLAVRNGVTLTSLDGTIGCNSGSTGVATVTGAGSTWTTYNLDVGVSGNGTLNITGGATVVDHYDGYVGYNSGSTGSVAVSAPGPPGRTVMRSMSATMVMGKHRFRRRRR